MARNYTVDKHLLVVRMHLIWSLYDHGYTGPQIAELFNMEKSWVSRLIKMEPRAFRSILCQPPSLSSQVVPTKGVVKKIKKITK